MKHLIKPVTIKTAKHCKTSDDLLADYRAAQAAGQPLKALIARRALALHREGAAA